MPNSNFVSKKISIIIVNFRSDQYLKKCIASLYNFEKNILWEVLIVNNDKDAILGEIKEGFSETKIINAGENLGFGKAANLGAKEATGEILFFLNPDSELSEDIFTKIIQEFEKDFQIAVISPKILDVFGEKQAWIYGKRKNILQLFKNNLKKQAEADCAEKKEVAWVSGAGMFVRKNDFEKIGGFDGKFFMYFEDLDLCQRMQEGGKKIIYFPEVKIRHVGSGSQIEEKERKKQYYISQDYYFQKHYGNFQAKLVEIIRKIFV